MNKQAVRGRNTPAEKLAVIPHENPTKGGATHTQARQQRLYARHLRRTLRQRQRRKEHSFQGTGKSLNTVRRWLALAVTFDKTSCKKVSAVSALVLVSESVLFNWVSFWGHQRLKKKVFSFMLFSLFVRICLNFPWEKAKHASRILFLLDSTKLQKFLSLHHTRFSHFESCAALAAIGSPLQLAIGAHYRRRWIIPTTRLNLVIAPREVRSSIIQQSDVVTRHQLQTTHFLA